MSPPRTKLYWCAGGSLEAFNPETVSDPIDLATAAERHSFHLAELRLAEQSGTRPAAEFHRARERELREAIAEYGRWRRAARVWPITHGKAA